MRYSCFVSEVRTDMSTIIGLPFTDFRRAYSSKIFDSARQAVPYAEKNNCVVYHITTGNKGKEAGKIISVFELVAFI